MQILQWLSKISQEPPKELAVINHNSLTTKRDKKATEILVFVEPGRRVKRKNTKAVEQSKVNCENLNLIGFLQRKDVSKAYFYHTLNLKKLRSFRKSGHSLDDSMNFTKREDSSSITHGGSKVLPITLSSSHSPSSSRRSSVDQRSVKDNKKEKPKMKNVSKMKELVRWASGFKPEKSGKFDKNGLHIKNKPPSVNVPNDDDQLRISESPKISFTWELPETNVSSSYSMIPDISTSTAILSSKNEELINAVASVKSAHFHVSDGGQCGAKLGNWITTDSEFVVLEL